MESSFLDPEKISLDNLAGGAAVERFNVELAKVLENILDENMEPTKKRSITLKVHFKPSRDRDHASMEVDCSATLAPIASFESTAYIGRDIDGKPIAKQNCLKQTTFGDIPKKDNVTPIKGVK